MSELKINSRTVWGMKPNKDKYVTHTPNEIVVHHNGAANEPNIPFFIKRGISVLTAIEASHYGRGWNGIGYHYVILPDGEIYEGRPDNVIGAHVAEKNTGKIGIQVYGNFEYEEPTEHQKLSLLKLINLLKAKYSTIKNVSGHREHQNTTCPGKNLFAFLTESKKNNFKVPEESEAVKLQEPIKAQPDVDYRTADEYMIEIKQLVDSYFKNKKE